MGAREGAVPEGQGSDLRPRDHAGFKLAFQQAPVAVAVVTGEAHTLVYANIAFHLVAAESGRARSGATVGAPIAEALPAAAARALLAVLDVVRSSKRPARGMIPGPPGADSWPCTAWPIADARARPRVERVAVAIDASSASALDRSQHRDVTERVLLSAFREEARADVADAARRAAETAMAARSRFLAATSHELRTPLQAIGGYAQLLEMGLRGPVTDGQRDALLRIQDAMQHVIGLTTSLLDQARIETGRLDYEITEVSAQLALRQVVSLIELQAAAKGLAFTVVDCTPELTLRADATRLRQVLLNLLTNAVKFTDAGGAVTVFCDAQSVTPQDGAPVDPRTEEERAAGVGTRRVRIRVVDTGRGIAADQLESVFDPYVQVGRRLTTRDAGVGLGLAISRELARGMGGDVTAESALGVGSTFTLVLPAS